MCVLISIALIADPDKPLFFSHRYPVSIQAFTKPTKLKEKMNLPRLQITNAKLRQKYYYWCKNNEQNHCSHIGELLMTCPR
jgi:hypothetical protein